MKDDVRPGEDAGTVEAAGKDAEDDAAAREKALSEQQAIVDEVERLWSLVFESSALILGQAKKYGFTEIATAPSPNIHDMLVGLRVVAFMLDCMSTAPLTADQEHYTQRQIMNSKQQIFHLEQVVCAVEMNDRELYDISVAHLKAQAPI